MSINSGAWGMCLSLFLVCGAAAAGPADIGKNAEIAGDFRTPLSQLAEEFPGVRWLEVHDTIRAVYGKPMTAGVTPADAASAWMADHADVFGSPELRPTGSWDVSLGKFTVFHSVQTMDGLDVDESIVTVLVLNGAPDRVVYAAARVAPEPEGGIARRAIDAEGAKAIAAGLAIAEPLARWETPREVVYTGGVDSQDRGLDGASAGPIPPRRAWAITGRSAGLIDPKRYTFFVDASDGRVLGVRDGIHYTDVVGNVKGNATPGTAPDSAGNPPQPVNLEAIRVSIDGGNAAYTNGLGDYLIGHGGGGSVTVRTALGVNSDAGRWVFVDDQVQAELAMSQVVTPPGPANFLFNPTPSENTTAQVNAFHQTTITHDFVKDRAPGFTLLDSAIRANTNINSACNAFYDGSSINFFIASGGCPNTAYSTVVSHEYGHHCVAVRGLAQGSFGEGFSDTIAMLINDTPIVAEDFFGPGQDLRNPDTENVQYPCNQEIHYCGMTVAGVWWEINKNFRAYHGDSLGFALTQQMFVDWYQVTQGGQGNDSAHPQTAIEVLTINDDDGDLSNGTPDAYRICRAFDEHSIACPFANPIRFEYPDGVPTILAPNTPVEIRVNVRTLGLDPVPGTGTFSYSINGGGFTTTAMDQISDNDYVATLPAQPCETIVRFYFGAEAEVAGIVLDPELAPADSYRAPIGTAVVALIDDQAEVLNGWTLGVAGDTATDGLWTWGDPNGTAPPTYIQPEDDHTDAPGVNCYFTGQGVPGGPISDDDVDGGITTLVTPTFDLTGRTEARLSYWRWYDNTTSPTDTFVVDISNNDGASWVNVETVGPSGLETDGGWVQVSFLVDDVIARTSTMKLRFIAGDIGGPNTVEAAIDDLLITYLSCEAGCVADFDGNGTLNIFDFLAFQTAFSNGDLRADIDGNGNLNIFDFLGFQTAFGNGC